MAEADAADRLIPAGADPRIGIFSHIGAVALNGVHDARIRMGDLVVVFGLGVPGQIVLQAARASGATVVGVDPVASRRAMAERLGADRTLDPTAAPISDVIKGETGGRGADICIEVSGAPAALAEAMRTVAYASRVVAMGFFQGEARGLHLGDEFHHNRIELISSQISGVAPDASHRWSKLRLWQTRGAAAARGPAEPVAADHRHRAVRRGAGAVRAPRQGRSGDPAVDAPLRRRGMRVGLLGAGGIGARHAAAVAQVEGLELVAACGRDETRTAEFAAALRRHRLHRFQPHAGRSRARAADRRPAALRACRRGRGGRGGGSAPAGRKAHRARPRARRGDGRGERRRRRRLRVHVPVRRCDNPLGRFARGRRNRADRAFLGLVPQQRAACALVARAREVGRPDGGAADPHHRPGAGQSRHPAHRLRQGGELLPPGGRALQQRGRERHDPRLRRWPGRACCTPPTPRFPGAG